MLLQQGIQDIAPVSYIPMCVMLQKEAALRLVASPNNKQYGVSTILLQVFYDIEIMFTVPENFV